MLDHDAVSTESVTLGLKGKPGEEPEISLQELESQRLEGEKHLVSWLSSAEAAKAGHRVGTKTQVTKRLADPVTPQLQSSLIEACQADRTLADRIKPFANIVRLDLRDRPLVFLTGAVYVTETGSRRDSGTAYTTKELADEIAEHALAPLCYSPGPQDDTPNTSEWRIRSSDEILALKVCDPAVGSGAILVAACRYLADRLIEAWESENDPRAIDTATAADDPSRRESVVTARRLVAEHCCYGVDRNPMAVEMAKLSLWLTTVAKDRPFTFLDHAIKSGDSLLGITDLDMLRYLHFDARAGRRRDVPISGFSPEGDAVRQIEDLLNEAHQLRLEMASVETIRPTDLERKQKLNQQVETRLEILATIADVLAGAAISTAGETDPVDALSEQIDTDADVITRVIRSLGAPEQTEALRAAQAGADDRLNEGRPVGAPLRRPLHWPIAFPEVFAARGERHEGFDAMVGNPPFIGGQKISGAAGSDYRNHLVKWIAGRKRGSADLVAYFFLAATQIARSFGYLATNTIGQGDTSEVGLAQIVDRGWRIHRAISSARWPGDKTLEIAKVWMTSAPWAGRTLLDGCEVVGVDEMLYPLSRSGWRKNPLVANTSKSFQGSNVLGRGFILDPTEAMPLLDRNPANRDVLFPYLGGDDLSNSPTHEPSRWIINFFDWPLERAKEYPECLQIIEERVRPQRMRIKYSDHAREKWWQYEAIRKELYETIGELKWVLAIANTSKAVRPAWVSPHQVLDKQLTVFAYEDDFHFGVLTSGLHYRWALRFSSTLETRIRYTPTDVFETFPLPETSVTVAEVARELESHRANLMIERQIGLTKVYNLFHSPETRCDAAIFRLRALHRELDHEVRDAYGWSDIRLDHGFYDVRLQGIKHTFCPEVADEVLDRLLELNKERYEAEVTAGLHRARSGTRGRRGSPGIGESLFEDGE